MDENVSNFSAITNADPEVARGFLEMSNNNLEQAIQLFFENPDLQNSFGAAGAAGASAAPPIPGNRPPGGGADDPVQIDSDDDTGITADDDNADEDDVRITGTGEAQAAQTARSAQEDEDAAMARRLQEELYGTGGGGPGAAGAADAADLDGVRSPIRATQETLVAPNPFGGGLDDDDMDMPGFMQQQIRQRQASARARGGPRNPFSHDRSIWDNDDNQGTSSGDERSRRLADLFRPPYDLVADLEWEEARSVGKEEMKWILVNFQDNSIFQCQMLNRDIWKDAAVRDMVQENFVFLQYTKDSMDAEQFMTFYFPATSHENPDNFPHVSIIDPRTGEQVKVWSGTPFPSAKDFHAQLAEFLDRYSLDSSKKNPVATEATKRPKTVDVDRMTEDEMLEMALQNSIATGNGGASGSGSGAEASGSATPSKSNFVDPDALTKEAAQQAQQEQQEAAAPSAFASIAADNPQEEPANDPATTTRIQFRHPSGRVIRRFALDDTVRRIYEWLKAAPLEGKEGVEFELKQMPQGRDLIESLETTIRDAGLKQGTVMIEFLQD